MPIIYERVNKTLHLHTKGCYYSATQKSEVLINATTWVNLENITVSERR